MADSILRLKVESQEYDSKLKRASEGIQRYADQCRKMGGTLKVVEKDTLEFVRAVGQMGTVSTTAKGKINEMSSSFVNLTAQYKQLTEAEKQSPFGKALSKSLDQLKERTQQAKQELAEITKELNGASNIGGGGGLFGGGKLDGMLQVFGGNLMTKAAGFAASFATEIAGCVTQGIELAKQGEGVRMAFERLGRGDILQGLREATHGTVTDLELMKAAVKFNDFKLPVEELGTMLAFAQQKAKDTGQSVDYMVDSIVTGLGRKSLMILDNLGLSANEIKEKMKQTGDMTKAVGQIIREQMAKSGDYIETAADRATKADVELKNAMEELGRTFQPLADAGTSMWTALETGALKFLSKVGSVIAQLTEAGRVAAQYGELGGSDRVDSQLTAYRGAKDKDGYRKAVLASYDAQIRQREQVLAGINAWRSGDRSDANRAAFDKMEQYGVGRGDNAALRAQINALRQQRDKFSRGAVETATATSGAKGTTTTTTKTTKGTKTEKTEIQKNEEQIKKLSLEYAKLGDVETESSRKRQEEIKKEIELLQQRNGLLGLRMEQAQGRLTLGAGDFQRDGLSNTPGTLLKAPDTTIPRGGLLLDDKAMKAVRKNIGDSLPKRENKKESPMDSSKKMLNAISQLTGGLKQMGIELPSEIQGVIGVIQGVMQVIEAVNTIIGVTQTTALTANTAAMISLEMALWANTAASAIPFANGGIVPKLANGGTIPHAADGYFVGGTHFSGDVTPIMANAGELVLNKAQQGNLASQLQGGGMQNLNLTATIKGEQIRLALNNNGRRTGRGEYVQSSNRV